jgi:hypothetical protein
MAATAFELKSKRLSHVCHSGGGESHTGWGERITDQIVHL